MISPPCTGARVFNVAGGRARGRQSSTMLATNDAVAYASYHGTVFLFFYLCTSTRLAKNDAAEI